MENEKSIKVAFAAIDNYVVDNIINNEQKEIKGQDMVQYGDKNIYPNYIYDLYQNVSILKSIIDGIADYVGGENITINHPIFSVSMNADGDTIEDIVHQIEVDIDTYGGFALNIVRNKRGEIAGIYNLDFKYIRTDKKRTKFYYSEEWAKKSAGRAKATTYAPFTPDGKEANSVYYYCPDKYKTYPSPVWGGSAVSAEILKHIGEFHLNSLYNGLSSDYIINFNSGKPSDEDKEEIEDNVSEKYTGFANASRVMLCFNDSIQNRTTVEAIPQTDFVNRFNAIKETATKDLYTAFRVHPALFGLPIDNTGFNDQDIAEAFKVANTTVILPRQKTIKRVFEYIFGQKDIITITPLAISFDEDAETASTEGKTVK